MQPQNSLDLIIFLSYCVFNTYLVKLTFQDNIESLIINGGAAESKQDRNRIGELAQVVERPLCMRDVPGSIPGFSICSHIVYSFKKKV